MQSISSRKNSKVSIILLHAPTSNAFDHLCGLLGKPQEFVAENELIKGSKKLIINSQIMSLILVLPNKLTIYMDWGILNMPT
jgi:hypothetical protein